MGADLGMAKRRDPDALPPSNAFELVMYWLHNLLGALASGNCVFAIKAGLLTGEKRKAGTALTLLTILTPVILALPYYIKTSANFAYSTWWDVKRVGRCSP